MDGRERGVSGVDGGYIPDLSAHSMILLVAVTFPARLLAKLIVIRPLIQLWYLYIQHGCTFTRGEWEQLWLLFSFCALWLTFRILKRQTETGWRSWAPQETKHATLTDQQITLQLWVKVCTFHHHHHVQEGLGLIPVPCILKMKLVPPSLPRSSYVSSSFWSIL